MAIDKFSGGTHQKVLSILVVEDNEAIGLAIAFVLTSKGAYDCMLARDAFQALEHIKMLTPDLFLFDYQLPKMNGLELYDYLHQQERLAHIPALVMSANLPTDELERRHLSSIEKPFKLAKLLQQVNAILADPSRS
jgi:CheY-like chemotaxis protein